MTRKTKYPFYLNAGNVLLPLDPDKPLSKWQVIALVVFITLAGAIIIIVALKSERQLVCSDSNVKCPTGTKQIPGATYTKDFIRDCCTDTTGSCVAKYDNNTVEKKACTFYKNKYDCTNSEESCEWVRPVQTGWKCDTSGTFGNTCYQAVNGPYSTAKECEAKSNCYAPTQ